jgi:hypothetical protein
MYVFSFTLNNKQPLCPHTSLGDWSVFTARYELKLYVSLTLVSEIKAFEEQRKEAKSSCKFLPENLTDVGQAILPIVIETYH